MHILITSDTVGGVWTYTQELVTGLAHAGHHITLVSFGKLPAPHQTAWMQAVPDLDYRPTEYRLEWMEVVERDIEESRRYLELLVQEVQPDVLHFSQYCYGDLPVDVPRIVVAHSDVVSWWVAVHGREPDDTPWLRRYRELVTNGLRGADAVIAPSEWMSQQVVRHYCEPRQRSVIHNGRTPSLFTARAEKDDCVMTVGRIWDPAKQVQLLLQHPHHMDVRVVGWQEEPGKEGTAVLPQRRNVEVIGPKSQPELRELYATAAIYAATSRYEPFGLSPLEAALSRCTLVMNDIAVFHELWGDAARYFKENDADDLARTLQELHLDREMQREYGERAYARACVAFTASRMTRMYEDVYEDVRSAARVA